MTRNCFDTNSPILLLLFLLTGLLVSCDQPNSDFEDRTLRVLEEQTHQNDKSWEPKIETIFYRVHEQIAGGNKMNFQVLHYVLKADSSKAVMEERYKEIIDMLHNAGEWDPKSKSLKEGHQKNAVQEFLSGESGKSKNLRVAMAGYDRQLRRMINSIDTTVYGLPAEPQPCFPELTDQIAFDRLFEGKSVRQTLILLHGMRCDLFGLEQHFTSLMDQITIMTCGFGRWDTVFAFAVPKATTIMAGEEFVMTLGTARFDDQYGLIEVIADGKKHSGLNGSVEIRIPTSEAMISEGEDEDIREWEATIIQRGLDGMTQEYPIHGEFTIRRLCN